jgi:hypothetical protein
MLKDGFRYCQTPLGKRISCQSLLVASLLLAQRDDPEPVNQCSQGEKHPVAGLEVLKGRKLTWINPTHIARQNEFRVCLAVLETHRENLFCDDGFPGWRCMKKPIPWRIG